MKSPFQTVIVIALAIFLLEGATASAGHYSWGGGYYGGYYGGEVSVVLGGPLWWPSWYYSPSYFYYPYHYPEVTSSPPVYIERSQSESLPAQPGVWYYCPESKSYYPYVRDCPGNWQTVPAQPPGMTTR